MRFVSRILMLLLLALALNVHIGGAALAQPADEGAEGGDQAAMSEAEKQYRSIQWQEAGADAQLGSEAHVKIPEGYVFTGRQGTQTLMQLYGNLLTNTEQGYIEPVAEDEHWFMVFEYEDTGHVKDDEKDELDADAILAEYKEGDKIENEERRKMGLPALNTVGWLAPPYYNEQTNNLEWALLLESEGEQNVNYIVYLLGREGKMRVTVVAGTENFEAVKAQIPALLEGFAFNPGRTYAEYQEGDKLADYGLMGLMGLAGAVGVGFFAKNAKLIFAGIAAAAVGVVSFIKKLFGRKNQ